MAFTFFLIKRVNCFWNLLLEEAILSSDLLSLRLKGKSCLLCELEKSYDTKTTRQFLPTATAELGIGYD